MTNKTSEQIDLASLSDDVVTLKRDIASLMEHIREGGFDVAKGTASDAIDKLSEETRRLYRRVAAEGERSVKAVSRRVEEQPLSSLLIAFGIGLVSGRLLSR